MRGGRDLFEAALSAEGVTGNLADVARSIYMQESGGGRNTKTSNAGAVGGMQIIPSTFKSVADKGWDISDPMHNARAGIRYLSQLDKQSGGNPALTAAGYYGGPGGMEKARKGIAVSDPRNPNAPNTLQYGQQVAARLGKGKAPAAQLAQVDAPSEVLPAPTVVPEAVAQLEGAPIPAVDPGTQAPPVQVAQVGPDPWQALLQQMQTQAPVQATDLAYGQPNYGKVAAVQQPGFDSLASYAQPPRQPDFRAFSGFKGRMA